MSKRIPPLAALRAFESASRHMSFARAANELSVTPAAVSHQIKQLEHWLGLTLFERAANGVTLTAAGRDYAVRIRDVFERLVSTSRAVRDHRDRTVVTIRSQFSIAALWLIPKVVALSHAQPNIEIRVFASGELAGTRTGTDLTLYHQRAETPNWVQTPLLKGHFRAYAAPSLVSHVRPGNPAELLSLPMIHTSTDEQGWRYPVLEDWFAEAGVKTPKLLPGLRFNLMQFTYAACLRGAGISLLLDEWCGEAVAAGTLMALPGPQLPNPHPYYLRCRKSANADVIRVRDWLLEQGSAFA
jgi:LysR family transcriptional regulator, glycine cleavage system transcriptional activator